ncbi:MAG: histidinol dehydrogenase [Pseudomonadota bacterium]|nr:histidinol dehydrogenase [Pseudomonadota bacterium]
MRPIEWSRLDEAERTEALRRPLQQRQSEIAADVARLIEQVRADGDATLRALTRRFDGVELDAIEVAAQEFDAAAASLPADLRAAIDEAYERIRVFHLAGVPNDLRVETAPGVVCERISRAIPAVGLYVPAGTAPLPSTALMLGVPAQIAGCVDVVMCSPPQKDGRVEPSVLYAASCCGIRRVFKLGGAQAIAAMAYGTATVPRCDKVFGPGNAWVTAAKMVVAADPGGAAIDLPAGPSEVLVIADDSASAEFVAADLLSQAEHGPDSQVLLLATSFELLTAVQSALDVQLAQLPRADIARLVLANSRMIVIDGVAQAIAISNRYAPEHLILSVRDARSWVAQVRSAGSVFLGNYAPESVGDYCSGTNHVLPTSGAARAYSGVSVQSFLTFITVQELTVAGLAGIGPCAIRLAQAEGLQAHARAISLRLDAALPGSQS